MLSRLPSREQVTRYLVQHDRALVAYAGFAAFMTYLCMYAARKPFSAVSYSGMDFFGITVDGNALSLKVMLGVSQVCGYFLSKIWGTKICSEVQWADRTTLLNKLLLLSIAALALFWMLPGPWKFLAMFLNGLPLGMVWGLVVGYLEGRRASEMLLAILSVSFIIGSGIVKDVGKWLVAAAPPEGIDLPQVLALLIGLPLPVFYPALAQGFSTTADGTLQGFGMSWQAMPFAVALLFLPAFLLATRLLGLMPRPTTDDEAERAARKPMDANARWAFFTRFLPGLLLLMLSYFLLTAYRDYQDYFGQELFTELGYGNQASIFTETAIPVALGVLAALALLSLIRSNFWGLLACFGLMMAGLSLQVVSTLGFQAQLINGKWWMVWVSLGSYLAYVPFGSVIFDRVIARTRFVGTAVFAIYLADATGYLGTILVKLYADIFASGGASTAASQATGRLDFFLAYTWVNAGVGLVCLALGCVYFLAQGSAKPQPSAALPQAA